MAVKDGGSGNDAVKHTFADFVQVAEMILKYGNASNYKDVKA